VSNDLNRDVSRTNMVDSRVAAVLRGKFRMERLRLAHELWELTRDRLTAFLSSYYPERDKGELQRRVANWFLHGSLAAFVAPYPAFYPEGRGMRNAEERGR
jgi:hypothetical protein